MRRHNRLAYDLVRAFNGWSLRNNWRLDIEGAEHLDIAGPAILAINHAHLVDGTVIMPLVRRRIRFLCDHRVLRVPALGQILRLMDVIPVRVHRPDPSAALAALWALRRGQLLGVFPEAAVSGPEGLIPARAGVAFLADALQVPVVPVAMWGVSAFDRPFDVYVRRRRPVIHVRVGPPLAIRLPAAEGRDGFQRAADAVMLAIAEFLPPRSRGVYAEGSDCWRRGRRALERGWVTAVGGQPELRPGAQRSVGRGFHQPPASRLTRRT